MSQFTIQLSPGKENDGYVVGYPGVPPANGKPGAAVVGKARFCAIPTGTGFATVEAKWVRIELRKIEIIPYEGTFCRYEDGIGSQPTTLWCSSQGDDYGPLVSQEFKFSLPIPESLPPSLELTSGAAIQYEVVASVCVKGKKKRGLFRGAKPSASVVRTAAPVTIKKYELHPSWPIFHSPQFIYAEQHGYQLSMERTHRCFGPGDSIEVPVTLQLTNVRSFLWPNAILQHFKLTLRETVIYRKDSAISPPVIVESDIASNLVPMINAPLNSRDSVHRTTITCSVPMDHGLTTLCMLASKHIDIKYTLCLQAVLNRATISLDIPVIISRIGRQSAGQALEQLIPHQGIAHTIPENKVPEIIYVPQSTVIAPNNLPSENLPAPNMYQIPAVAVLTDPINRAPMNLNLPPGIIPGLNSSQVANSGGSSELERRISPFTTLPTRTTAFKPSSIPSTKGIHPIQLIPAKKLDADPAEMTIQMGPDLPTPPDYWSLSPPSNLGTGVEQGKTTRYSGAIFKPSGLWGGEHKLKPDIGSLQFSDDHIPQADTNRKSPSSLAFPIGSSLSTTTGALMGITETKAALYMGTANEECRPQLEERESTATAGGHVDAPRTATSAHTNTPHTPPMPEAAHGSSSPAAPARKADTIWYLKLMGRVLSMGPNTEPLDYCDYIDYTDPSPTYTQIEDELVSTQYPTSPPNSELPVTINRWTQNPKVVFDLQARVGELTSEASIIRPLTVRKTVSGPRSNMHKPHRLSGEISFDFQFEKRTSQSPSGRVNARCLSLLLDQYQLGRLNRVDLITFIHNIMSEEKA